MSRRRFALIAGGLSLLVLAVPALIAGFVWADFAAAERQAAAELLRPRLPLVLLLLAAVPVVVVLLLRRVVAAYAAPAAKLAEAVRVMQVANRAHRVAPEGAAEMRALAEAVNALAQAHEDLHTLVQARIDEAHVGLVQERNQLAALMSELAQGVIVCNSEGLVLLYNRRAASLLQCDGALLGLGRSVLGLLDRDLLIQAQARLADQLREGLEDPVVDFSTARGRQRLRARMAPVPDPHGGPAGFVLLLEDQALPDEARSGPVQPVPALPAAAAPPDPPAAYAAARPVYYDFQLFAQRDLHGAFDDRSLTRLACTVFDTETTGPSPSEGDEIIAIGAVRVLNGRLLPLECFDRLVRPRRAVRREAQAIHGIGTAALAGEPPLEDVLPAFHRFAEDTVLVGHNVAFDMRLLQLAEGRTGLVFAQPVLDTLLLSAVVHPGHAEAEHRLDAIADRLGVPMVGRHTALGDALATAAIFVKLLPLLAAQGIHTLAQAREASQRTRYAKLDY